MPAISDNKAFYALIALLSGLVTSVIGLGVWAGKLDERVSNLNGTMSGHIGLPAHFTAESRFSAIATTLQAIDRRLERIETKLDNGQNGAAQ